MKFVSISACRADKQTGFLEAVTAVLAVGSQVILTGQSTVRTYFTRVIAAASLEP